MENTALLIMDYQNDILKLVEAKSATLLKNASSLLQAARKNKVPVIYVQVAFRPGYPEISVKNKSFGALKGAGRMVLGNPGAEIHEAVKPLPSEPVVIKHRVGAYHETDMATILRGYEADHLIMFGISTSGVILSTLRAAADADYKITVVEDACADSDEEVHNILMKKVYPRQADVISTQTALELFK